MRANETPEAGEKSVEYQRCINANETQEAKENRILRKQKYEPGIRTSETSSQANCGTSLYLLML